MMNSMAKNKLDFKYEIVAFPVLFALLKMLHYQNWIQYGISSVVFWTIGYICAKVQNKKIMKTKGKAIFTIVSIIAVCVATFFMFASFFSYYDIWKYIAFNAIVSFAASLLLYTEWNIK